MTENTTVTISKEHAHICMRALDALIRNGEAQAALIALPVMQAIDPQLVVQPPAAGG
jgi:hypothetical protein